MTQWMLLLSLAFAALSCGQITCTNGGSLRERLAGTWVVERLVELDRGTVRDGGSTLVIDDKTWAYLSTGLSCDIVSVDDTELTTDCGFGDGAIIQIEKLTDGVLKIKICSFTGACDRIVYRRLD